MAKKLSISGSELEIMEALWDAEEPLTSVQIAELFSERKGWKLGTIYSFLNRLAEKEMLSTSRRGKTNYYTPAISREEYRYTQTADFVKTVHGGRLSSLCAALGGKGLKKREIEELREWLDGLEE